MKKGVEKGEVKVGYVENYKEEREGGNVKNEASGVDKLMGWIAICIAKITLSVGLTLMELKNYKTMVSLFVFMHFFFALINTTSAGTLPELPAKFFALNAGKMPYENQYKQDCLEEEGCSKTGENITVTTIREGVETDKRPMIGDLYD